jgi:TolB-like protein/DNA-binding SARP family transcriptional activator
MTFGTLTLLGPDDETVLGRHGHHRRRLALLAVLAAAGERGRSRDQLLALFWPEVTQDKARHSLDQLLYALRSTIGEAMFVTRDPVRLDPAVLASDVEAFNRALELNDLEAAVELHRGPFLDGFHLGDGLEFERWLDTERARLERRYETALERLAQRAESAGDPAAAVEWWRRLAEADPLSGKHAARLIRALHRSGDYASALRYAERYESTVSKELGSSVGPDVASAVAELRAALPSPSAVGAAPAAASADHVIGPPRVGGAIESSMAEPRARHASGRRIPAIVISGLTLIGIAVIAVLWMTRAGGRRSLVSTEPAIAVLPFTTVAVTADDSVLVDGLTDELRAALSRIAHARVLARSSTFALRGSPTRVRDAADRLGATYVVEGSVQWSGPRLRVQARLLDGATGAIRWTETYDRERQDVFVVEGDIAAAVASELGLAIAPASMAALRQGATHNIAAYELYLRGRDPMNFRSEGESGPVRGLAYLQQAVALDSSFAAAYANMPYMYVQLVNVAPDRRRAREYKRLADSMAQRAVRLDPLLPEAHTAVGAAGIIGLSDLRGAEHAFRRSIALGGSPRVHENLANVLGWTGRPQEALAEAMRSAKEDPLSATATAELGKALCLNRRYTEGLAELAQVARLRPPLLRVAAHVAICYGMQGRWREAVAELRDRRHGRLAPLLAYVSARAGDTTEAMAIRDELIARWRITERGANGIAIVSAGLGEFDETFAWLDRAIGDLSLDGYILYPLFDELHADPRWPRFLSRLGLQNR